MRSVQNRTIREPARDVPVYGDCDVLVVGGGPAGSAAAIAAARAGAVTVLAERYGYLGGLSTGGLVCWIDRMTDWDGTLVVGGIGAELMDRLAGMDRAIIGPSPELWGSRDPEAVAYWRERSAGYHDVVSWSPTVDPEALKLASNDLVRDAGVHTLFHCWAVAPVMADGVVGGAIFESKQGRFAVTAGVTIDCTGDGDLFAEAGAAFETDSDDSSIHALMNGSCRFAGIDHDRFWQFRTETPAAYKTLLQQAREAGAQIRASIMPQNGQVVSMNPKFSGYSPLSVADLTEVEFRSRDAFRESLDWWRVHMPGWEQAYLMETSDQVGVRHSRRLVGVERIAMDEWRSDGAAESSIGLCPGTAPAIPTLEIPLGSLIPAELDGLLVAGRNLSCDSRAHNPLREVPECWVLGQGAGVAAAVAFRTRKPIRAVDTEQVRQELNGQGAIVDRPASRGTK